MTFRPPLDGGATLLCFGGGRFQFHQGKFFSSVFFGANNARTYVPPNAHGNVRGGKGRGIERKQSKPYGGGKHDNRGGLEDMVSLRHSFVRAFGPLFLSLSIARNIQGVHLQR